MSNVPILANFKTLTESGVPFTVRTPLIPSVTDTEENLRAIAELLTAAGVDTVELFETLEEFFISLNFDSDLYFGIQQGDNGMSLVLGGRDVDGTDRYNELSEMCLIASTELSLIDPKINLRVDKETPLSRLALATELTKRGLGFPQYANDDIVIPGLLSLGYAPRDAYDYVVAACWEFIVPGCAFDIPNEGKVNFPLAVSHAVAELLLCPDFPAFFDRVTHHVKAACHASAQKIAGKIDKVSPLLSAFIDDCIERGRDAARGGARYQNYGAHGVGIAPAADAIMAVKCAVFDEGFTTKEELLSALAADFEGYAPLRNRLAASADACERVEGNRYHITKGEVTRHFAQFFPYATYEMTLTGDGEAGFRFHIPGADACVYLSEKTVILQT